MDCVEVLPEKNTNFTLDHRNESLEIVLGKDLTEKLQHLNLFMVGVGALGCELIKNFAMLSIGCGEENLDKKQVKGKVTMTDPDMIELSNLTRQFLFREKHIGMPKSLTAASAVVQMNPYMKNHIVALQEKVFDGTSHIFNDNFFES
jgi:molybdopterin/thiamine biosynthesis adenylyltransferase